MIPLRDANPTRRTPWVTLVLIAINVALFFLWEPITGTPREQARFFFCHGAIPEEMIDLQPIPEVAAACGGKNVLQSLFTSMFLHGGFLHIAGNMLYLWVFGNNVEDRMGRSVFLLFYLAAGLVAAYAQALPNPSSQVPLIGASGATAGTLGAYIVMFPHARVLTLLPIFFFLQLTELSAWLVLGFWFVLQAFQGVGSLGGEIAGVAWWAHIGGFVFGAIVALLFYRRRAAPVSPYDPYDPY
ncbi:MAG TPA: rhomboid family intramembrane serine protease [Actinomycetota bacterium]|nr:rhomboid family intramembrane serine protease [Actinomycetota bacterium]